MEYLEKRERNNEAQADAHAPRVIAGTSSSSGHIGTTVDLLYARVRVRQQQWESQRQPLRFALNKKGVEA